MRRTAVTALALDSPEALRPMGSAPLGRIVTRHALPTIRPVNHVLARLWFGRQADAIDPTPISAGAAEASR